MEMWNRTLMELVRSISCCYTLPYFLWIYALKTTMYMLNEVPNKTVPKTLLELWTVRKSSLRHIRILGLSSISNVIPHKKILI